MIKVKPTLALLFTCILAVHLHAQFLQDLSVARAPSNDDACTAMVLSVNSICSYTTSTNENATASPEANPGCGNYNGGDVWFQATVPSNGILKVTTQAGSVLTNGAMAFYTGADCNSLSMISCDRNSAPGSGSMPEILATGLIPGSTIWIRFWEDNNNDFGTFEICATTLPSPTNDEPCNATSLSVNSSCIFSYNDCDNTNATGSMVPDPGCANYSGGDIWFQTTVPANGYLSINTEAGTTLTNGGMAIYSGNCNSLTLLQCDDDDGDGNMPQITAIGLTPGSTLWIRFWEKGNNDFGSFGICVSTSSIIPVPSCSNTTPAGDNCLNATQICELNGYCGNTSVLYDNSAASWPELNNTFQSCASGLVNNDSFLKFIASSTTATFDIWVTSSTGGDGIQMMFFDANSCGSGAVTCHGGFDNMIPRPNPHQIQATNLTPGNTYYLMIDGVHGDNCNYVIQATSGLSFLTASSNTTICRNQQVTLQAGGINITGATYTWTWTDELNTPHSVNGTTLTDFPHQTTEYTVTVSAAGICNQTKIITVTVIPEANAGVLSGQQQICSNNTANSFTSTVSGGIWTSSNTSVATIDPSSGLITPRGSGTSIMTYTVDGTSVCPDASNSLNLTIHAIPTAGTLSGTQNICLNNNTNIFSSTVAGGTWSSSDNTIASINNSGLITPVSAGTTAMTYTVADASGICPSATQSLNLTITSPPSAGTLSGTQNICINNTTTSFSSTQTGGSWSSSNTSIATINSSTGVITPVTAGNATMTYTVTGTGGCANATDTRTINITAIPSAGTLTGIQNICLNNTANTFSSTVAGGTWSSSDNTIATINNSGLITPVSAGTTTMTFTVADASGFCPSTTQSLVVNITSPPSAGTLSGNQNICINNSSTSFSSTQTGGSWSSSNNSIATINSITGAITPVTAGTATMTYTVTGTGGCANATDVRNINIVDLPTATIISNNGPVCKNSNAIFTINGTPNATITYQINGGSTRSIILDNTGTGNITLSAVSSTQSLSLFDASLNGCSKSLAGSLSEVQILPFTINLYLIPTSALPGTSIQATVSSTNGSITGTIWQPSTLLTNNNANQTFIAPGSSTNITVTATSAQGCTDSKSQFLEIVKNNQVYFIPNAFIPGRGNDPDINTLKLYGPEIKSATLKIFNQWGQCIFVSDNPKQKGWDGKYKGNLQPAGVYVYGVQITFNDGSTISKTGSVDLIR